MTRRFIKDALGWGFLLWLVGYIFGIVLFMLVPPSMIGWVIMPIGILYVLWILFKKIISDQLKYYLNLAIVWTVIAIVFDYLFLVKLFKPADGYYKLDVYIYYVTTFLLPLIVGVIKNRKDK